MMMMMRSTTVADRIQSGAPARPNLNALLEATRDHKMTWQDRLRQKRSWLVGNRPASDTRSAEEVMAKLREDMPELFADEMVAAQADRIAELEALIYRSLNAELVDQQQAMNERIAKLEAEVALLREALAPFASDMHHAGWLAGAGDDFTVLVAMRDLRRARATLAALDTGGAADGE